MGLADGSVESACCTSLRTHLTPSTMNEPDASVCLQSQGSYRNVRGEGSNLQGNSQASQPGTHHSKQEALCQTRWNSGTNIHAHLSVCMGRRWAGVHINKHTHTHISYISF